MYAPGGSEVIQGYAEVPKNFGKFVVEALAPNRAPFQIQIRQVWETDAMFLWDNVVSS